MALTFLGQPYVWGGETPATGFDCSGLVKWCYGQQGVKLPKWARMQWEQGKRITLEEAMPGDLLFFIGTYDVDKAAGYRVKPPKISHVAIYLGGRMFISADSDGVSIDGLDDPEYLGHYYGARKVLHG